ncbi:MAG TPA: RIP metalloprotease [Ktedonobacterales bacterium]|nr:RIP metalloprotease [Ktedonobacterales bacterium]
MSWYYYLAAIPVFAVIVLIHELGHFITARWADIRVEEFGIGFPPRAFGIKRGETLYSINWLPIGGFVRMTGETGDGVTGQAAATGGRATGASTVDAAPTSDTGAIGGPADPRSFAAKPAWRRIVVLLAGVTMNMLLAIVLLGAADVVGKIDYQPYIGSVVAGSPAQQIGLQVGDDILSVNGKPIKFYGDLIVALTAATQNAAPSARTVPVVLVIQRAGVAQPISLTANILAHPGKDQARLGVGGSDSHPIITRVPIWQLPQVGVHEVGTLVSAIFGTFGQIATGQLAVSQAFTGPVGIVQVTGQAASAIPQSGWYFILYLTGFLSVSLAVVNALPIPALDGGRVLLILVEIVRRGKRLAPEREGMINLAGMAVLLCFVLFITFFDFSRIFTGN